MSTTIEHDGFSITSNHETEAQMFDALGAERHAEPESESSASPDREEPDNLPSDIHPDAGGISAEPPKEKKGKPRDNPQARISQAVAKQHEAERKAAELEARLVAFEQARQAPPPPAPVPATRPLESDIGTKYRDYPEYIEALADWKYDQRAKPAPNVDELVERKLAERELVRQQQALVTAHEARMTAAHQKYPDLQEAMDTTDQAMQTAGVKLSPAVIYAIAQADNGGDVLHYLATHPQECIQLARDSQGLDAAAAPLVRQLLDTRLGAGARPGAARFATESRAKPPIKPVGASPQYADPDDASDEESFEQHFKRENSRDRKAGRL